MKKNSQEEERLRSENARMEKELKALGGVMGFSKDLPVQLKHQFLQSVFEMEKSIQKEINGEHQRGKENSN